MTRFIHRKCNFNQVLFVSGKHAATGWIQEKLEMITLPDISGDVDILIGSVHYTLTG